MHTSYELESYDEDDFGAPLATYGLAYLELESYDDDYFGDPLAKYGLAFAYLDRNKDRAYDAA